MNFTERFDPNQFIQLKTGDEIIDEFQANINSDSTTADEKEDFINVRPSMFGFGENSTDLLLSVDEAFDYCGGFGRHQTLLMIFMIFSMKSAGFFLNALSFLELQPVYECQNLHSDIWYRCQKKVFCSDSSVTKRIDWSEQESLDNFISQFHLECSDSFYIGLIGSFFLVGIVLGCLTLTRLGDILGRKPIFIVGMLLQITVCCTLVFIDNIWIAYLMVAIMGVALTGKQYVGYTYLIENMPKSKQVIVGSFEFICEGLVFLSVCGYFLWVNKNWIYLQIPTLVLSILGTVYMIFQPESPRFLVSKGRFDQARTCFNIIAKRNGKGENYADLIIFKEELEMNGLEQTAFEKDQDPLNTSITSQSSPEDKSLKQLFKRKDLRRNLLFSTVIWTSIVFNFFLVSFYLKYFPGSIFLNCIYFAIADIFAYLLSGLIIKYLNASKAIIVAQVISSIGALLYLILFTNQDIVPVVIILSRIGNSMSFNTVYVTNSRLFPTYFQTSTFGLLNFISHVLSIGGPLLAEAADPYPYAVFLTNAILALFSGFFIKELYHSKAGIVVAH
ncbi:solute carrier family member 5 [Stylonychia lemnae]|uniref:Solute carrier family member 5 n=1 Tax=Stylonychia lemnae TaxID=5949 RepID=A0A078B763_STYLE|nr:solute carrier family member 5 [Stylonychia lemnae]|eukprot:CDW89142.1 solute carrier family member 5 [Stylonychia lemnae]